MNVGDLVTIRPAVAPPKLYGIGLVVKVTGLRGQPYQKCYVKWPTMPDRELRPCARYALELVSGSR
jgi:hypothetical protein